MGSIRILGLVVAASALVAPAFGQRQSGRRDVYPERRVQGVHPPRRARVIGAYPRDFAVRAYRTDAWRRLDPGGRGRGGTAARAEGATLGFPSDDPYLGFSGTIGELYSHRRYESDRRSADARRRARASYFSRPSFWRDGHRYVRSTVYQGGRRYDRFHRL